jgi:hypothetical protein
LEFLRQRPTSLKSADEYQPFKTFKPFNRVAPFKPFNRCTGLDTADRSRGFAVSLRSSCSKDDGLVQDQRGELGDLIIGDRVREASAPG